MFSNEVFKASILRMHAIQLTTIQHFPGLFTIKKN